MTKKVLNFKLEYSEKEEITPYGGLAISGELYKSAGLDKDVDNIFPAPGSSVGFNANTYINSLVMMFMGGGKYIEDIRKLKADKGLRKICKLEKVPSGDAVGDWLRREKRLESIKESEWKILKDKEGKETGREYAEFIHTMDKTISAFRIVVQRWVNPQRDLFEKDEYCYHGIATNYLEEEKESKEVIKCHNGRSNSENYNKEVKIGFNLDYMPCDDFNANGVWFVIGILAYNLFTASKILLFPKSWMKKTITTVRWQFIQIAGKIISRSRCLVLRICSALREIFEIYEEARRKCLALKLTES